MKPRNVIVLVFLPVLVVLVIATGVQARDIEASDIRKQIENGTDICIKDAHILGELNISEIKLNTTRIARVVWKGERSVKKELKVVKSEIVINDSVFEHDVNFSNTQFDETIDFRSTTFSGKTDFRGASFNDNADFWNADFNGDTDFEHATFNTIVDFRDATFKGDADFDFVAFYNHLTIFNKAAFKDAAHFNYTKLGNVHFSDTNFTKKVFLREVDFKGMKVKWSSLKDKLAYDGPTYLKLIKISESRKILKLLTLFI